MMMAGHKINLIYLLAVHYLFINNKGEREECAFQVHEYFKQQQQQQRRQQQQP